VGKNSKEKTAAAKKSGYRGEQKLGRLQRITTDWELLVIQACYSSPALARICGVSLRHLQRHIQSEYGKTLCGWLNDLRLRHAYQRLADGCTVKEAAFSLGYKQVSHFSRNFKNHFSFSPSSVPITGGFGMVKPLSGSQDQQMQLSLFDGRKSKVH
jgi:AraC-like DNA-binding protein